jgi:hypothetical protein
MELVDRYLDAVRRGLPTSMQADVTAELSDDIHSRIEEREVTLDRPLSMDETSAILKDIGHPVIVASRYHPHQQLIGPALFPFYVKTLKIVLSITLSVVAILALTVWASGADALTAFGRFWGSLWTTLFTMVGIVTIIFAAVERLQPKDDYTQAWDPKTLPPVPAQHVSRATLAFELGFNLFFIWCLLHVADISHAVATVLSGNGTASLPFALGTWWQHLIVPFLVATMAFVLLDIVLLARPDFSRLRAATVAVTHAFLAIVVGFVLTGGTFVMVATGVHHPERYANAAAALNGAASLTLACFVAICIVVVIINVRKLMRRPDILTGLT